jgi:hypothetical protein
MSTILGAVFFLLWRFRIKRDLIVCTIVRGVNTIYRVISDRFIAAMINRFSISISNLVPIWLILVALLFPMKELVVPVSSFLGCNAFLFGLVPSSWGVFVLARFEPVSGFPLFPMVRLI